MEVLETRVISTAIQSLSPNQDMRPDPEDISLAVIHCISLPEGEFGGNLVHQLFTNDLPTNLPEALVDLRSLRVSSHLLIDRKGVITQFVPFHRRAWHAGVSTWRHRPNCNDYSIGIELEGSPELNFEEIQYSVLLEVLDAVIAEYPKLSWEAIVGHAEISPGRKVDPGPRFDWHRVLSGLSTLSDAAS